MHDIWNPWHGCVKKSEGCANCYMFFLDKQRGGDGSRIYKVKNNFNYPLQRNRDGSYKVKSGEQLRVCMTSDFFLQEADQWRPEVWRMIKQRPDVIFFLLTKRPERVRECLPDDWGEGWENVFFNVTCENQERAEERLPLLMELPFKHKGVMAAPFIGELDIRSCLETGVIEQVIAGGENYDGSRVLKYEWVKRLYDDCVATRVRFCFIEIGSCFEKDGKFYRIADKRQQSVMAYKSGLQYEGRKTEFKLCHPEGNTLFGGEDITYEKQWHDRCFDCGSRLICNGCANCGLCVKKSPR